MIKMLEHFPLAAIQLTGSPNYGGFCIYSPVTGRLFEWTFPPNGEDYIELLEAMP